MVKRILNRLAGKILLLTLTPLVILFLAAWLILVPIIERGMLETRREYLRHLTESACTIFVGLEAGVKNGMLTREEAQRKALELMRGVRFGKTGYFYVFTRELKIVTVPIKPEMEGKDVSGFKDAKGAFCTSSSPSQVSRGSSPR